MDEIAAVLVAGGRGERAGGGIPKQYREVAGTPVIRLALSNLGQNSSIAAIQPVIHPDDIGRFQTCRARASTCSRRYSVARPVNSRSSQVLQALETRQPHLVLVHDAARPFVSEGLIARALTAGAAGAAVPVLPVTDTVKVVDPDGKVAKTLDRDNAAHDPDAASVSVCAIAGRPSQSGRRRPN